MSETIKEVNNDTINNQFSFCKSPDHILRNFFLTENVTGYSLKSQKILELPNFIRIFI